MAPLPLHILAMPGLPLLAALAIKDIRKRRKCAEETVAAANSISNQEGGEQEANPQKSSHTHALIFSPSPPVRHLASAVAVRLTEAGLNALVREQPPDNTAPTPCAEMNADVFVVVLTPPVFYSRAWMRACSALSACKRLLPVFAKMTADECEGKHIVERLGAGWEEEGLDAPPDWDAFWKSYEGGRGTWEQHVEDLSTAAEARLVLEETCVGEGLGVVKDLVMEKLCLLYGGARRLERKVEEYVGLEAQKEAVKLLVMPNGDLTPLAAGVTAVGLHGKGGVGKSVVAAAIYDDVAIRLHFRGKVCWAHMGECEGEEEVKRLQESIVRKLCGRKRMHFHKFSEGHSLIRGHLGGEKVLIVLDNVRSNPDRIVSVHDLGPGSCLLMTSRKEEALIGAGAKIHTMSPLGKNAGMAVLCQSAFRRTAPPLGLRRILEDVVGACGGLPLALKVVGCGAELAGADRWTKEWWHQRMAESVVRGVVGELAWVKDGTMQRMLQTSCLDASRDALSVFVLAGARGMLPHASLRDWPIRTSLFIAAALSLTPQHTLQALDELARRGLTEYTESVTSTSLHIHDLLRNVADRIAREPDELQLRRAVVVTRDPVSQTVLNGITGSPHLEHLVIRNLHGIPSDLLEVPLPALRSIIIEDLPCRYLQLLPFLRHVNLTALHLSNCRLEGLLLREIGQLATLQWLDLSHNELSGNIPSEIGQLAALRWLDLGHNRLSGSLPCSLSQLTLLQMLDIQGSKLTGSVPEELCHMAAMRTLVLSYEDGFGAVPDDAYWLPGLERLIVTQNRPSGSIRMDLGQVAALDKLRSICPQLLPAFHPQGKLVALVMRFQLVGPVPLEIAQLAELQWLNMSCNELCGPIPTPLCQLSNLCRLNLSNNELSGPIPLEIGQLKSLRRLDLSNNLLSGSIPPEIGILNVRCMDLSNNRLTGSIPPELGLLKEVEGMNLSHNRLTGLIPRELGRLSGLKELLLQHNLLQGEVPLQFVRLSSLTMLNLSHNQLTGGLFAQAHCPGISQMAAFHRLNLSHNLLTGAISESLAELGGLLSLDLSNNSLSGSVPVQLGQLASLEALNLSENQISGPLPVELANLTALQKLHLGRNKLTGPIPAEIGQLSALRELHLSSNQLVGMIPQEFGQLAFLQELDLNNNRLSGPIVTDLGQLTALEVLLLRKNLLTGPFPLGLIQLTRLQRLELDNKHLDVHYPIELQQRLESLGVERWRV